jgi:hypothetical protein
MDDFSHDKLVLYKHLGDFGLPPWSKSWLNVLMDEGRFPPVNCFGAHTRGWWASDLRRFLENLPRSGEPLRVLWEPRPRSTATIKNIGEEGRKGRPPGGRLVVDLRTGKKHYRMRADIKLARPTIRDEECYWHKRPTRRDRHLDRAAE